jgi:hypothetical protein
MTKQDQHVAEVEISSTPIDDSELRTRIVAPCPRGCEPVDIFAALSNGDDLCPCCRGFGAVAHFAL